VVNRAELRKLAEDRVLDAEAPLKESRWSGAYYLAGYAVECGLKACVKSWSEVARYQQWTERQARKLYEAVTETANGALPSVKVHW
jgi:hypothetical protein